MFGFNPRRCISTSSLSECTERNKSKVKIALQTNSNITDIYLQIEKACVIFLKLFTKFLYSQITIR